jgi:hypothetical protein
VTVVAPETPSDAVDGCDLETLRRLATELAAPELVEQSFEGEVPHGEARRRLVMCEPGAPVDACIPALAEPAPEGVHRHVHAYERSRMAVTVYVDDAERVISADTEAEVDRQIAQLEQTHGNVMRGRTSTVPVLRRPEVCVSERSLHRARLPQLRLGGVRRGQAFIAVARSGEPVVVQEDDDGHVLLRCRAEAELEPPLRSDGPCAALSQQSLRSASTCRDDLGHVRVIPSDDPPGYRFYLMRDSFLHTRLGVRNGDIITHVCGHAIEGTNLQDVLRSPPEGCSITGLRRGVPFEIDVNAACGN